MYKVRIPTYNPLGLWVYHVDAQTLEILYYGNELFSLKTGKGNAYKTNRDWHSNKISKAPLKYMFTSSEGLAPSEEGALWGLHAMPLGYDAGSGGLYILVSPSYDFRLNPSDNRDFFDMIHAYYQMNTIWEWWNKNIIRKYGPSNPTFFDDYDMPVIVNDPACNAGYGYAEIAQDVWIPIFVFGNESACVDVLGFDNEDFSAVLPIPLTTIQHPQNLAKMAYDILKEQIKRKDKTAPIDCPQILLPPKLIVRQSSIKENKIIDEKRGLD